MRAPSILPAPRGPWRRRLVLCGVATATVLAHGWGLSTVGRAAPPPERATALTVRSVPAPVALQQPAVEAAAPAAEAQALAMAAAPPAGPARHAGAMPVDRSARPAPAADVHPQPRGGSSESSPEAMAPPPAVPEAAAELPAQAPEQEPVQVAAVTAGDTAEPSEAIDVPVYPTRLPAAFTAHYTLHRGLLSGTGSLRWAPAGDGSHYEARLEGSVAGFNVLDWTSTGALDRAGVAPERFLIRRRGRDAQAANFQRGPGKITYSGPSVQYDLPAGAQDRLSWMLQIGGVLNASPQRFGVGSRLSFFVSGARGDADLWHFAVLGLEKVELAHGRETLALKLLREPRKLRDTRVEVWLDPAQDHRPVRARLSTEGNGDALELRLAD
ncbi:DUF3108 domain-containing protein [Aquincola sp. MAHUQ-54]|uniref:DUF3108 domain-containing protein n=1 Tax=Aquincola agrisoli TaxID=3119538 RepID=A0AAW9QIK3_9BURK